MSVWKKVLAVLLCAGMMVPTFAAAAETTEESESITAPSDNPQAEPAAEEGSGEAGDSKEEAQTGQEPAGDTVTTGETADEPVSSEDAGTESDPAEETSTDTDPSEGSGSESEPAEETGSDPGDTEEGPAETVTVTFRDGDTVLLEVSVQSGSAPAEVPRKDSKGEAVAAWISEGAKVADPSEIAVSADTVYTVWHIPALNTQTHPAYISGKGNAIFEPNNSLTRAEASKIIHSLLADPSQGPIQTSFSDVKSSEWYGTPVNTLSSLGVINGYEDGSFRPNATITRAEFVTMLSQFAPVSEGTSRFSDVPADHWASRYIVSAAAKGWVSGNPDGTFLPAKPISRAEAVTIMNRVLGRDASAAETQAILKDNNVNPFADVRPSDWFYSAVMEASTEHEFSKDGGAEKWTSFAYKSSGYSQGVQKIAGKSYAVDQNGQIQFLPSGFQKVSGKLYYVSADGSIYNGSGFQIMGEELYYFQADSSLAVETSVGSFNFNSAGHYTTGNVELDNLVKTCIRGCTNTSMTQYEKLRACYLYLRENCRYLSRPHHPRGSTYWTEESAIFMFKNHKGNCYCFAGAFYYMARQLGYDAQPVSGGFGNKNQDHAWVMINNRMFDPEIEYAYLYRFSTSRYYNCFDIARNKLPFVYHFPK